MLANIALFVPFGVAAAWRGYRLVRAAAFALALSVAMRDAAVRRPGTARVAQLDDVILNFGGAIVGWVAYSAIRLALEGERRVAGEVERRPR